MEKDKKQIMPKTSVHFDNIQHHIIKNLQNCKEDLKIAVAWFTDREILKEVYNLSERGVNISVIVHNDHINDKDNFKKLYYNNAKIFFSNGPTMHNKFCVIDTNTVINGSYNWTTNAQRNDENIQITHNDVEIAKQFENQFNNLVKYCDKIDDHFERILRKTEYEIEKNRKANLTEEQKKAEKEALNLRLIKKKEERNLEIEARNNSEKKQIQLKYSNIVLPLNKKAELMLENRRELKRFVCKYNSYIESFRPTLNAYGYFNNVSKRDILREEEFKKQNDDEYRISKFEIEFIENFFKDKYILYINTMVALHQKHKVINRFRKYETSDYELNEQETISLLFWRMLTDIYNYATPKTSFVELVKNKKELSFDFYNTKSIYIKKEIASKIIDKHINDSFFKESRFLNKKISKGRRLIVGLEKVLLDLKNWSQSGFGNKYEKDYIINQFPYIADSTFFKKIEDAKKIVDKNTIGIKISYKERLLKYGIIPYEETIYESMRHYHIQNYIGKKIGDEINYDFNKCIILDIINR